MLNFFFKIKKTFKIINEAGIYLDKYLKNEFNLNIKENFLEKILNVTFTSLVFLDKNIIHLVLKSTNLAFIVESVEGLLSKSSKELKNVDILLDTLLLIVNEIDFNIRYHYEDYLDMETYLLNKLPNGFPFITKDVIPTMDKFKNNKEFMISLSNINIYLNDRVKTREALDNRILDINSNSMLNKETVNNKYDKISML